MKYFAKFLLATAPFLGLASELHAFTLFQDEEPAADEEGGEDEAEEEEESETRWFAITNADIHTGTGAVLRGATVLSRNGKITEIGYGIHLPEDTEVLDAMGMRVYPGLVALAAATTVTQGRQTAAEPPEAHRDPREAPLEDPHFGLDDVDKLRALYGLGPEGEGGVDAHVEGDHEEPVEDYTINEGAPTAEVRSKYEDAFDPFSEELVMALATGITTADNQGAAIKLKRGEIDGTLMNDQNQVTFPWGTGNPAATRGTREKFAIAAKHRRALEAYEALDKDEKKEKKEPKRPKGFDSGAFAVLMGQRLARFNLDDREDLSSVAAFAQEYGFRPVIWGCREGWTVAGELGRAGAYAVITPRDRAPKDERLLRAGGSSIENAAILHAHGVQVATLSSSTFINLGGITGRDLLHLPVEAAFGVRGGLSNEAALASLTLVPARILGVDHRIGTLEVGKDLDAIVTDGDVLHYQTFVQWTVVAGKLVYDKQDEIYFAHIRPRPEPPAPPAEEEAETETPSDEDEPAAEEAAEDAVDEPADEPSEDEEASDDDGR